MKKLELYFFKGSLVVLIGESLFTKKKGTFTEKKIF